MTDKLTNYGENILLGENQQILVVQLELGARILREQHLVTNFHIHRNSIAIFIATAFASGDYGFVRGGYLNFIERLGGVVKSGGENVSLAKVSAALVAEFSAEFETLHAVAIADPFWGDRVVAIGRPRSPGAVTTEAMRARCKARLAAYEIPRTLLEWHEPWPVSAEGKLGVKQLREYAAAHVDTSQR